MIIFTLLCYLIFFFCILIVEALNIKVIKLSKNGYRTSQGIEIQVLKNQQTISNILQIIKDKIGDKQTNVNFETLHYYIDGTAVKAPHLAIADEETLKTFITHISDSRKKNITLCLELLPEECEYLSFYFIYIIYCYLISSIFR